MTNYQRALVQCPLCKAWYVVPIRAGKRGWVSLNDLAGVEAVLTEECKHSHHRGRKRVSPKS